MKPLMILIIGLILLTLVYPTPFNKGIDFVNQKSGISLPHLPNVPFRLGLDLLGGTHLVYEGDLSTVVDKSQAMEGVRDVIERRVNLFGVSEPVVQIEGQNRLVVELAGISDINQAIQLIGETPFLEFKEERTTDETNTIVEAQKKGDQLFDDPYFKSTDLNGRHVKNAQVNFDSQTGVLNPQVSLELNDEGAKIFEKLTEKNLNKRVAIYLDGQPISIPVVQSVIAGGKAVISGKFTIQEAKQLSTRLNAGALPVPIKLISQQTIGASLGQESLAKSLKAGLYGFLMVAIFMILFYRLPGLVSVYALSIYVIFVLAIYKFLPITLSLSGIAGFILSLGIAVDANVLIFARMREELAEGKSLRFASEEGFKRAWSSIRDSHVTTLLGSLVLYIFTTSIVKGFALTLGVGVLMSLFSAIVVTRQNLKFFLGQKFEKYKWLF